MMEDSNNTGGAMFNAAGLKMQRLNYLIEQIQDSRRGYNDPSQYQNMPEAGLKCINFRQWVAHLESFKFELYAKLNEGQKSEIDVLFKCLFDLQKTHPLFFNRRVLNEIQPLSIRSDREIVYLSILRDIESKLMIFFNQLNMDNPDKPQEGGYD